jgi:hypothetical protein
MMDAEINNVIYMGLYSGPKMAHGKYGKKERSTVYGNRSYNGQLIAESFNKYFVTVAHNVHINSLNTKAPSSHDILLSKIDFYGISGKANSLIKSCLQDRYQKVLADQTQKLITQSGNLLQMEFLRDPYFSPTFSVTYK